MRINEMITKAKLLWSLIEFSTIHFRSNFGDHLRSGDHFRPGIICDTTPSIKICLEGFLGGRRGGEGERAAGVSVLVTVGASTDVTQVPYKDQALLEQMKEKASEDLTVQITYKYSLRKNPMPQAKRFQELKLWSEPTGPEDRPWLSRLFPDRFRGPKKTPGTFSCGFRKLLHIAKWNLFEASSVTKTLESSGFLLKDVPYISRGSILCWFRLFTVVI